MELAIIGAGLAGLAAARRLRETRPDIAITIYEKSRGLGGRAATRRRDGYVFDHGAQYLKGATAAVERLVTDELPNDDLIDIALPVWTFDGEDTIAEGDAAQNAEPKWSYRDGLNRLGKLLGAGQTVRREVRIGALHRRDGRWHLDDVAGNAAGSADAVLLTPPAPQISDMLRASTLPDGLADTLLAALGAASYRRCISFALAYDRLIARPFYALVNTDRKHPISWLALEHQKHPDRCPPGHSLLLPQMAAQWSMDNWETPSETLLPEVLERTGALLGDDLDAPLWYDVQRWRYALADSHADFDTLNNTGSGLFFAGDYTTAQSRAHLAIESGWRVAEQIAG